MQADYQALIDELKKPLYLGTSDQQAADLVNALMVEIVCNVPRGAIIKYAVDNGIYGKVNADAYDTSLPRDQRIAIWNIKGWVDNPSNPSEVADMESQTAATMIADLVRFGYATTVHAQELAGMSFKTIKWTESVGLPEIGVGLVRNARKMIGGSVNG